MTGRRTYSGLFFILIGALIFVWQLDFLKIFRFNLGEYLVPLMIIGVGLVFELAYFSNKTKPSLLVPGGTFLVVGSILLFQVLTNEQYSKYVDSLYIFSVVVGLMQLYFFNGRKKNLLIVSGILSLIGVYSFYSANFQYHQIGNFIIPALLIFFGLIFILNTKKSKTIEAKIN